jgi:hypothetical protein
MTLLKNYAGSKHKSFKITMQILAIQDKAKPHTHRKHKTLKLGGGQAYNLSIDKASFIKKD